MSGTQWAKMCHQAGLVDSAGATLTSVDADLVYVDVQRREFEVKGMKFPFEVFAQEAVPALAEKAGLSWNSANSDGQFRAEGEGVQCSRGRECWSGPAVLRTP
ncbi:hypothetical protein Pmar_PMAR026519 [Perkinsus marinus ATCC 50983]|uniref:Uncharacterized protein n=1 Tax=Perkinsus marinus (strain ATCC 50983 / TXsc) TaxID=423536 RepID=C5LDS1_PERM5|nr:hypothetical protein Pmar_PMAR026519 [Perkinsus marinus ATCC 50983]EER05085.1 hypothetical protein Pmar_PMAR026519 [Perkinsus marinus ATCC 50983]|eukprot:XP_002773269.1 hypothetical protein Pmar_PMAR026519 [Perkinsus marinus ATCC 50983]